MSSELNQPPGNRSWLNEPGQWEEHTGGVWMRAEAGTDFWRKTHDGGQRDNGHFYFERIDGDLRPN